MESLLLLALVLWPFAGAAVSLLLPSARAVTWWMVAVVAGHAALAGKVVLAALAGQGPALPPWLYLDALSAYHLGILDLVFLLTSLYARGYFAGHGPSTRYGALWLSALGAMTLVLVADNLGVMWVGVETTTLVTAFLIYTHRSAASLEAMWKYIIICSVGVAFAFMGTLLVAASARGLSVEPSEVLAWTRLSTIAAKLHPDTVKAGFLFLLVGYGTKAGLAPMHSWLPDAHSQAPAPVSALFSGFMLNTALYCVLRYMPIVEGATGPLWANRFLLGFGLLSMLVAAAFIVFQQDIKRLLAYSTVEHMGIILVGVGLGGAFAALLHTLNHSLAKTLGFFCAGRLGQAYGTHDMQQVTGALKVSRVWGTGLVLSVFALVGLAPFALFLSELQILKAAADHGARWTFALFVLSLAIVFVGAVGRVIHMSMGAAPEKVSTGRVGPIEVVVTAVPLVLLLLLGLWLPAPLKAVLTKAAGIVGGSP